MKDPITPKEKMLMKGRVPFCPSQGLMLEAPDTRIAKMDQLFRMGLANKGERVLMLRALKRDEDALKDPLLRKKLYTLLDKMTNIITSDKQIYRQFRQNVQRNNEQILATLLSSKKCDFKLLSWEINTNYITSNHQH